MSLFIKYLFKTKSNLKQYLFSLRFVTNVCKHNKQLLQLKDNNMIDINIDGNEDISSVVRYKRNIKSPKVEDFLELYRNDSSLKLNIELICAEFDFIRLSNNRIKQFISINDMKELLQLSPISRQRYYNTLFLKDTKSMRKNLKKIIQNKNKQNCNNNENICNEDFSHKKEIGIFDENGIKLSNILLFI
jgi:hypothetical protein